MVKKEILINRNGHVKCIVLVYLERKNCYILIDYSYLCSNEAFY